MGMLYCFGARAEGRAGIQVNLKSCLPQFLAINIFEYSKTPRIRTWVLRNFKLGSYQWSIAVKVY